MPAFSTPLMEFHISRQARDRYQFDQSLFSLRGNVIFANFHGARLFAQRMNQKRDLVNYPEQAIRAGQINALGLIDEILHFVVQEYRQQKQPQVMAQALEYLYREIGQAEVERALQLFSLEFPPVPVYRREMSLEAYLEGATAGVPHRQVVLEEMLMLWIANANPACDPYTELFDDDMLEAESGYAQIISALHDFFDSQPTFGPDSQNLIDMLRTPAIQVPHSLPGQLEYIRTRWSGILGQFLYRLLSSLDLIKEEEKIYFAGLGAPPSVVYEFAGQELELERFSPDREWMPSVVVLAKNAYVWLDQLSKQLERSITRLDQIPEEELEKLGRWGFTGLWLIGLWERSQASKRIKQLRGNPDAVASAYSLYSYDIAADLGGDEAYKALRDRAWKYGIRLASDMVPNHMGIDSRWLIEHPDWFIALDYSPFPSYSFSGPNLSNDDRVGIYLEDHYYNNSDAAVVFKRVDFWSGQEKYIYHGNDGTSMPWNDTAQLDYLKGEVREAVIQTILHVARKFPIIRFDAAMTLAKKHYQRLWYPVPGSGGDIPSRAEQGLTREQFDAAIPQEFWREVVDRVTQEVPDTLLLAEAFWLMEGYFVRTLGMHRVYNSAFMNMLRDEKNQEYRLAIKNTVEFDPEILKRYVNFMNNPDERTAVDQFGKGDKYFGICTLMSTLPGLPMFGHGQIEGFTEKYGMEFRRAYWDEQPDGYLIDRHVREIFPLLRKRYLFAEARDFRLYDFISSGTNAVPEGAVNEDVFAYSNRAGEERTLVIYHNKFATARGWVRTSSAYPIKTGDDDASARMLVRNSLGEGLGLLNDPSHYTIFRDHASGLEYIRNSQELHHSGLFIELEAYKYHVFLDFRQVQDTPWQPYSQLATYLNGRGVPSIEDALKEIFLQNVHHPYREIVNAGYFRWLIDNRAIIPSKRKSKTAEQSVAPTSSTDQAAILNEFEAKIGALLYGVKELTGGPGNADALANRLRNEAAALLALTSKNEASRLSRAYKYLQIENLKQGEAQTWGVLIAWLTNHRLGEIQLSENTPVEQAIETSRSWIDEWLLGKFITSALQDLEVEAGNAWRAVGLVKLLTGHQAWFSTNKDHPQAAYQVLQSWLQDSEVQQYLGVNRYQGVLWFNKESFETWLWWMFAVALIQIRAEHGEAGGAQIVACYQIILTLLAAQKESRFQLDKLLEAARVKTRKSKVSKS